MYIFRGIEINVEITLNYRYQNMLQVRCLGYCPAKESDLGFYMESNIVDIWDDVREHMYRWHGDLSDAQNEPCGPVSLSKEKHE